MALERPAARSAGEHRVNGGVALGHVRPYIAALGALRRRELALLENVVHVGAGAGLGGGARMGVKQWVRKRKTLDTETRRHTEAHTQTFRDAIIMQACRDSEIKSKDTGSLCGGH